MLLYDLSNNIVAFDYIRIVYGGRGEYIEFDECSLNGDIIFVPVHQKGRLNSNLVYYNEYRTNDDSYVKIYYQKAKVSYADYKIGFYYMSVYNIIDSCKNCLIENEENPSEYFF